MVGWGTNSEISFLIGYLLKIYRGEQKPQYLINGSKFVHMLGHFWNLRRMLHRMKLVWASYDKNWRRYASLKIDFPLIFLGGQFSIDKKNILASVVVPQKYLQIYDSSLRKRYRAKWNLDQFIFLCLSMTEKYELIQDQPCTIWLETWIVAWQVISKNWKPVFAKIRSFSKIRVTYLFRLQVKL